MRARLALMHCGAQCEIREILLKEKPPQMLEVSSKGTVPVLVLPTETNNATGSDVSNSDDAVSYRVIDESIDIMRWAMYDNPARNKQQSKQWLITETMSVEDIDRLIEQNDGDFKYFLDKYKYSDRHPEHPQAYYLEQAMPFLEKLDGNLSHSPYLGGRQFRFPDAALLPFIRQFSMVNPKQFNALALPALQQWLAQGLESELFLSIMQKLPQWKAESGASVTLIGNSWSREHT